MTLSAAGDRLRDEIDRYTRELASANEGVVSDSDRRLVEGAAQLLEHAERRAGLGRRRAPRRPRLFERTEKPRANFGSLERARGEGSE